VCPGLRDELGVRDARGPQGLGRLLIGIQLVIQGLTETLI